MQEERMKDNKIDPSSTTSTLFPAYAVSNTANLTEGKEQEWLYNSSFTADAYNTFIEQQKVNNIVEDVQEIEVDDKRFGKKHIKRKKRKRITKEKDKNAVSIKVQDSISESPSLKSYLNKLTFIEDTGLSIERAFRLDLKPDHEMHLLGSFDRTAIAKYFQSLKIPLGSSKLETMLLQKITSEKNIKRCVRYFSKQSKTSEEITVIQSRKDILQSSSDYIPLDNYSSKSLSEKKLTTCFDGISTDWKLTKTSSLKDSVNNVHLPEEQELQKRTAQFNNSVIESPHDEQLWLNFVDFQHHFFQTQSFFKSKVSEKTVIEKQIAILDKALSHNPSSVKLTVAKLKLRRNLQETEQLLNEWEKLIFYHPNDVLAWQQYLLFIMSDVSYFTIPRIIKIYKKCLKSLCSIEQGILKSHLPPPGLLFDIIEIFGDLCITLHNSGHTERAFGTFQAIMEFNLFPPSSIIDLYLGTDRITFFEPFWDCGSARIGEQNALGWAITVTERKIASGTDVPKSDLSDLEDKILTEKLPIWQIWLEFEKLRMSNHWLPWRPYPTMEETSDDVDDPDRIVSFEQISGFLFKVDDEKFKYFLFCKFLSFLGVKLHLPECSYFPQRSEHSLLLLEDFDYLYDILSNIFPNRKIPNCFILKNNKLFDSLNFLNNAFIHASEAFSGEYKRLIALLSLRHSINMGLMTFYGNETKSSLNLKNLRKSTKSLLKKNENRNCLYLWSEYIHIEYESGNEDSADQMFERLYASSSDIASTDHNSYKELWYFIRRYVEIATGIKQCCTHNPQPMSKIRNKVVVILSYLGSNEKYTLSSWVKNASPTMLIRALTNFKIMIKHEFSLLDLEAKCYCKCLNPQILPLLDCLFCGTYLHYFAQGLDSSLKFLEENLHSVEEKINKGSYEVLRCIKEQIYVCKAELFNFHHQTVPSSLKNFHLNLCEAIEKFPGNVRLLHMLVKTKTASAIIGPTRRFFFKLLGNNLAKLTPLTWLFAIVFEHTICCYIQEPLLNFEKQETLGTTSENVQMQNLGIVWKIRSLFEKCIQSASSSHCVALWRSYVNYEMQNDKSRALIVFHKALQNCAWSKALLLDGIEYFNEDYQQLVEMMAAKQLRIRTPLEEVQLLTEHMTKET